MLVFCNLNDKDYVMLKLEWCAVYFTEATGTELQFLFNSSVWSACLLTFLDTYPVFHLTMYAYLIAI